MRTVRESARDVPVIADVDVLVVGSGPGGLGAALAAARAGVKTMVVERFGCLGGNITVVGVESIAWYRREHTVDSEGIGIELEQRAKAMGATSPEVQSKSEAINADMFKVVADRLVAESGVTPLLHAMAIDTVMEGDTLRGVIVHSKSGRGAILARRIVDASGDADIAAYSGAPYRMTAKERMLPVRSDMFRVVGDRRVAESGVTPLLHAMAIDTVMEGDTLRGVIVHSKSGRGAILARRIVDASGDADIAAYSGAPYRMTAKERMLPV